MSTDPLVIATLVCFLAVAFLGGLAAGKFDHVESDIYTGEE